MVQRGLSSFRPAEAILDTRKKSLEIRSEAECF